MDESTAYNRVDMVQFLTIKFTYNLLRKINIKTVAL